MAKPWTSELVIQALGVKKCNGDMDSATESLPMEKVIGVAQKKSADLTGYDLKAQVREVIGTCVAMRVKVDGKWPKEVLREIANGDYDEQLI